MIVEEYTMAMVAKWHLLDMEQKTTVDKKLEIEYLRDDSHSFKRFLFNHAFYEGLKVTEWIGSDCYDLSLQSISNPTSNKSHYNLHFSLNYIPESQELIETMYHTHFELELARHTEKAILTRTKEVFHQLAPLVLETYKGKHTFKWGELRQKTGGLIDRLDQHEKWLRGQY
ncbi:hypothetical protein [Burkholderia metallica]|uniref:hypothetical protein n=1 Tax=Burkholderia metallica TaxID=488729 RepID=UPI00158D4738|nr:hypothetical protein [Burkholderia metallica]